MVLIIRLAQASVKDAEHSEKCLSDVWLTFSSFFSSCAQICGNELKEELTGVASMEYGI